MYYRSKGRGKCLQLTGDLIIPVGFWGLAFHRLMKETVQTEILNAVNLRKDHTLREKLLE